MNTIPIAGNEALRRRAQAAERQQQAQRNDQAERLWPAAAQQALYELRVNRIQLAMQNEELRQSQLELDDQRKRYFDLYDLAPVGYCTVSSKGLILEANLTAANMMGAPRKALVKQPFSRFINRADQTTYHLRCKQLFETGQAQNCEIQIVPGQGEPFWANLVATAAHSDGVAVMRLVLSDISERKRAEEMVREMAYYDPLTGLANRTLLKDRLTQSMLSGERSGNRGALIFLDLDNFKPLNDQHGHEAGDLLLAEVARRIKSCVRQIDTVARFGGDEFVVLLDDLTSDPQMAHSQADLVAEKIRKLLAEPYVLQTAAGDLSVPLTIEHRCTASIGVALFRGNGNTVEEVLKWADQAMYHAKDAGRNTVCFCDAQTWNENTTRQILEEDLRNAVLNKQFCVYFQAQFDREYRVIGADALLRWQHPSRGWVSPREFIPKAERTGLILPMGLWVLESACLQLAQWAKNVETADLTVTVNISGRQLAQSDFFEQVMATLERTGARPHRLKLEIKESVLLADIESVIAKINALKAKGIGLSLDDFGKGHSSLSGLNRLPLDQIKIDQDFVRDILTDPDDAAVAKMVVALADSMEVAVIAEGVETEAQRDFLASLGCHKYQGHLLSPALPAHEFEVLVARVHT